MMIAALIVVGIAASGVVLGLYAAMSAPVGYQDQAGFHFGGPDQAAETRQQEAFAFEATRIKA
jgi:hypothetical protein